MHGGGAGTSTEGGAGGASDDDFDRISSGGPGASGVGGVGGGGGGDNRYYGAPGGGGSTLVPVGGGQGLAGPDTNGYLRLSYDLGPITSVGLDLADPSLPASGTADTVVTVSPRTAGDAGLSGMQVTLSSTDPGQSFGPVTDLGDGDDRAVLHGSTTVGTASILATVAGEVVSPSGATTIETVAYTPPAITAALASAQPPRAGWYRTPVTATFTCTGSRPHGACPAPATLAASGRNQVVTRTIGDDQGRSATATVTVSIDRVLPTVKVTGAKPGATYGARRTLVCQATDALSGVASCTITTTTRKAGKKTVVRWTGTALDRAGNTAVTTGRYTIRTR